MAEKNEFSDNEIKEIETDDDELLCDICKSLLAIYQCDDCSAFVCKKCFYEQDSKYYCGTCVMDVSEEE